MKANKCKEHGIPYRERALEKDLILFNWKSDSVKLPLFPEYWLTTGGSLGFIKESKRWVIGEFNEILDDYGDYMTYIGHTLNTKDVKTFNLKNHEEVIVCGNTPLYRGYDNERDYFAFVKEETDRSILCNLIMTRINSALVAVNDQQKKMILQAYKEIVDGYPLILVTSLLEDLNKIELTDPKDIDKLQYLTSFYQSIEKREANASGIDLDLLDKRAQVSTTEIQQYDDVTTVDYLVMYEMRKKFVDEMRENGFDIEIVPNPIFFDEPKAEDIDEGTFEDAKAEEEPEAAPEEKEESENENNN